jgi:predicted Rossmann fold nucleotide-binding protein DprA/Smf involved in DNA uptake
MILHKYRGRLREKKLVFLPPLYSEAGFNPGNVMTRNKYIYCRANAAVAVHSAKTGGTWNGAIENLATLGSTLGEAVK